MLPLARLDERGTYLVAWDARDPLGHAHIAWAETTLGVPEIQDVFVLPERRRMGVARALTLACEKLAAARSHETISLVYSVANDAARRLYEGCGYVDAGIEPLHVTGTIGTPGQAVEVDDTLIYLTKRLTG